MFKPVVTVRLPDCLSAIYSPAYLQPFVVEQTERAENCSKPCPLVHSEAGHPRIPSIGEVVQGGRPLILVIGTLVVTPEFWEPASER